MHNNNRNLVKHRLENLRLKKMQLELKLKNYPNKEKELQRQLIQELLVINYEIDLLYREYNKPSE